MLASNKQQHKEITKNRKTQQDRQNTQKRTAEKNKDEFGLQEAPHLQAFMQNHLEYSKCWNSKKEIFLIEQYTGGYIVATRKKEVTQEWGREERKHTETVWQTHS